MTATVSKIPDPLVVLRRAEQKHTGEEPGDLDHLAEAVRVQIITPLTAGGRPVAAAKAPVDDVQVKQLLADKQRLDDLVTELRKHVETNGTVIDRQVRELAALKKELKEADADAQRRITAAVGAVETVTHTLRDEVEKVRTALTLRTKELDEARAERDTVRAQLGEQGSAPHGALEQAQADNARLADELAMARRSLDLANRTLDEIADEQEAAPATVHVHQFPLLEPGGDPQPCACRQPFPRSEEAFEVVDEEEVHDVEPWAEFFDRMRYELEGT